jgi:hypothetical protein
LREKLIIYKMKLVTTLLLSGVITVQSLSASSNNFDAGKTNADAASMYHGEEEFDYFHGGDDWVEH